MPNTELHADVRLGPQGRLLVPAAVRRALGFQPGDALIARVEAERLVVEKAAAVERRLHEYFRKFEGRSLADELIVERREEAARKGRS
ncbi:MAG: AbrB/MazE/SpoVT family DNA-binding domain-containing protein [Gammaproteobacteria bacterium]|nr:AbrB/MazE/SpoVT family DNA-binding domain-containing protein [Gammaproteobacteria bacterium]MCY4343334.1 AbrB/MazE/SpoVT family DNA-binding domain-containing protein [Gammaproteobacteria bacterium]